MLIFNRLISLVLVLGLLPWLPIHGADCCGGPVCVDGGHPADQKIQAVLKMTADRTCCCQLTPAECDHFGPLKAAALTATGPQTRHYEAARSIALSPAPIVPWAALPAGPPGRARSGPTPGRSPGRPAIQVWRC